ncbi:hypothetical protein BJX68DRAFT_228140 [Aspergillus pseudodeflectus]|uniref:Uncharacterized protein n=1 Tax=Aspergillus pseudodeflectus TaxID=176178 RepID=A0ABR4L0Z4_9EURO
MDSPPSTRSSPSKALNPLSPERMNQQAVQNSPSSVSDVLRLQRKARGLSDVQAKVAYLNGLNRSGSPGVAGGTTSTGGAAALQRAILGREEAETALTRVSSQLSEAQSRERRISERLESLLEELQTAKERQAHERIVFEKEIRKARKEAFRAGSTLVKVQEELKHAKAESKALKEEVQSERDSKEKAKQEAFERAYAIAGLTEELEELKGRLRTAEANLEQEINRQKIEKISIAETGSIATQTSTPRGFKRPADEIATSPRKSSDRMSIGDTPSKKLRLCDPPPHREGRQYGYGMFPPALTIQELIENLEDELMYERNKRIDRDDEIEFMKVSCMFKACQCRHLEWMENEARAKKAAKAAQKELEEAHVEKDDKLADRDVGCSADPLEQTTQENSKLETQDETPRGEAMEVDPEAEHIREDMHGEAQRGGKDAVNGEAQQETHHHDQEDIQGGAQETVLETVHEGIQEETKRDTQEDVQEEVEEMDEFDDEEPQETTITFSPVTGTFHTIPSPTRSSPLKQTQDMTPHHPARFQKGLEPRPELASPTPKYESHPHAMSSETLPQSEAYSRDLSAGAHHSSTTAEARWQHESSNEAAAETGYGDPNVQRIPLRAEDESSNSFAPVPGTPISREQALAQIRARRGRTSAMKRSVSANDAGFRAGGLNITPVRAARRIPGVVQQSDPRGDAVKKSRRDMSAPMRMFR